MVGDSKEILHPKPFYQLKILSALARSRIIELPASASSCTYICGLSWIKCLRLCDAAALIVLGRAVGKMIQHGLAAAFLLEKTCAWALERVSYGIDGAWASTRLG